MIDIRTGREMTRREFGKGLAAIIGAGVAPSITLGATRIVSRTPMLAGSANGGVGRGMMRNVGARQAVMFGGGGLSAKSYVQDGLTALFDGIENEGYGLPHNPNLSGRWNDLSGNLSFNSITGSVSWMNGNSCVFNGSSFIEYVGVVGGDSDFTVEVCNIGGNLNTYIFSANTWKNDGYAVYNTNVTNPIGLRLYSSMPNYESYVNGSPGSLDGMRMNTFVRSGSEVRVYKGGLFVSSTQNTRYAKTTTKPRIGAWFNGNGKLKGRILFIRCYNRALKQPEIAANYVIDQARFNLP